MKVGVLTGGGDCPGLNSVIQSIVLRATYYGFEVWGIEDGYKGLIEGRARPLKKEDVKGIHFVGGTILGSSRKMASS